jgi:hypothetical protein
VIKTLIMEAGSGAQVRHKMDIDRYQMADFLSEPTSVFNIWNALIHPEYLAPLSTLSSLF